MSDIIFVDGLIVKEAKPDFVICKLSVKVEEFVEFCNKHENKGWVNIDILESKAGKLYSKLNDYKPKEVEESPELPEVQNKEPDTSLPF